jgi:hypothetical protein
MPLGLETTYCNTDSNAFSLKCSHCECVGCRICHWLLCVRCGGPACTSCAKVICSNSVSCSFPSDIVVNSSRNDYDSRFAGDGVTHPTPVRTDGLRLLCRACLSSSLTHILSTCVACRKYQLPRDY